MPNAKNGKDHEFYSFFDLEKESVDQILDRAKRWTRTEFKYMVDYDKKLLHDLFVKYVQQNVFSNERCFLVDTLKDGNCMFHAIGKLVNMDHIKLRKIATDQLKNCLIYEGLQKF